MPEGLDSDVMQKGAYVGDPDDLQTLIAAGEVEGTEHVDADDVERDPEVREIFLAEHGYDEVPEGFEVHHIIPLSEGGADDPDNMILVSEEDHDVITAAHRAYYHWNG